MIPPFRSRARASLPARPPSRRWRWSVGVSLAALVLLRSSFAGSFLTRAWTTDDGLPHNHVHTIRQDATGFLWIATEGGLVRFDGHTFRTYTPPPELRQSSQQIRTLVVDPAGGGLVVVGGSGDVLRFRDETFSPHPATAQLNGNGAMDLHIDPTGALWVGTREGVLHRWHEGHTQHFGPAAGFSRRGLGFYFAHDDAGATWISAADFVGSYKDGVLTRDTTVTGRMIQIVDAHDGAPWALIDGRLHRREAGRWAEHALPSLPWEEAESSVRGVLEASDGALWFATATAGLLRHAAGTLTLEGPSLPAPTGLMVDRENTLWVSTAGGLRSLRPRAFQHYVDAEGIPTLVGTSVTGDDTGTLWFANRTRGVIRLRDGRQEEFRTAHNHRTVFVNSVVATRDGTLWLGAISGLFRATTEAPAALERVPMTLRNIEGLHRTRSDDLWVAAHYPSTLMRHRAGAWRTFGAADGFSGGNISAIVEDAAGTLWVGTEDGELFRNDGERFTAFPLGPKDAAPRIHSLHVDPEGTLWIGTAGGLYGRRGETLRRFSSADGLPEDFVTQVISDDAGRLWFGGARGYYSVGRDELHARLAPDADVPRGRLPVRGYGRDEGLPGISAASRFAPTTWKDAQGRLWFATPHGVLSLDPRAITPNPRPPPILVDRVRIDGRELPSAAASRIAAGAYRVEFQFAAPSFTAPERVRLRHRLEGVDPDWVDTPATRSAHYTNLPPGPHRLRVIGANGDGVWNETGATFTFTLEPAWWQTLSFQIGAALATAVALIALAHAWTRRRLRARIARLEHAQAVERERARIARNLHDELGSAITSLGFAVEHLAHRHPSVPLREELGDRVQRAALDLERVVWTVSPRNDSLDRLVGFIGGYAERYFRETPVRLIAPTDLALPAHPVLPEVRHHLLAVVKEALQNVLKHAHATQVEIAATFIDGVLTLSIRDDGIGFDQARPRRDGHGLANLHARVGEIGGALSIRSAPGAGTAIEVGVPLPPSDNP